LQELYQYNVSGLRKSAIYSAVVARARINTAGSTRSIPVDYS